MRIFSCTVCVLAVAVAPSAHGQNFPVKPVRVVTAEAGGGADFVARTIAQELTTAWGQQVIVDNRGRTAVETVLRAPSDGYTMLLFGSNVWLSQFLRDGVPWDPLKDFSPITVPESAPNIIVAHPALAARSIRELISLAKAKPGALNYGSGSLGGANHLSAELFKSMAGVDIVRVPYKGTGPAVTGLIGGEVQLMFATMNSVGQHLKSGKLKALAVTSARPSALAPGLPTVASSGLSGYESASLHGIFTPGKTPAAMVARLNRDIVKVVHQESVKEKFLRAGLETVGNTPEQFTAMIKHDIATLGKLIREIGIRE